MPRVFASSSLKVSGAGSKAYTSQPGNTRSKPRDRLPGVRADVEHDGVDHAGEQHREVSVGIDTERAQRYDLHAERTSATVSTTCLVHV